jgi:hypothetical protein
VADRVGQVDEPALIGPLLVVLGVGDTEGEVGRLSGLDRRYELVRKFLLGMEDKLDLLAGLLLKGGDDLPERVVLLGVAACAPPHDKVGGLDGERRQNERSGENRSSGAHILTSRIGRSPQYRLGPSP